MENIAINLPEEKKYVCLYLDEMEIRDDLVYDRRGGSVIGFLNPIMWKFKEVFYELQYVISKQVITFYQIFFFWGGGGAGGVQVIDMQVDAKFIP